MDEIRQYYKFRPDEIFRRITVTSLVTLMVEVSKLEYQQEDSKRLDKQIREDQESLQKAEDANNKESDGAPPEEDETKTVSNDQEQTIGNKYKLLLLFVCTADLFSFIVKK